jgi:hypothetical protein
MNEVHPDGGEGGSAAGSGDSGASGVAGGGAGVQSSGVSVLSAGAGEAGAAGNPFDHIPEKYRVFGEDKSFNLEASTKKLSEGYANLSKRLGTDEPPPESADAYQIDGKALGEGFDADAFMKDEKTKGFLKSMHAKGLTNAQVQAVLEYGLNEWAPDLLQGNQALTTEDCTKALRDVWSNEAEFKAQLGNANKAFSAGFAGMDEVEIARLDAKFGNDPDFIKFAARFGAEMREDSPSNEAGVIPQDDSSVEMMMLSEEYKNPKHPKHSEVTKKVQSYFAKKYGNHAAA